ncbi:MAG: GMC family oxidoreductase N-terminal domain-containing protein [Pseudomonadota bacterium]
MQGDFDYIIVGAGSAGSVLAYRLGADPRLRILMLEAGGSDLVPSVQVPIGYGLSFYDARRNWKYTTEPEAGLGGRTSYWPRGKVLGGSSSINAMVYVRGHAQDFDDWQAAGATGWGWSEVEPYYRKLECWSGPSDQGRGRHGPLSVEDISGRVHPLCDTWLKAGHEAGIGVTEDYNGGIMDGAMIYQLTTKSGLRASTARCYLRPAMRRGNVRVVTGAHVEGIDLEEGRAVGLRYRLGQTRHSARATREIVLSAGAVNTPQILQLSGIGPGDKLQSAGVAVSVEAPAVGQHMQDHLGVDLHFRSRVPTLNQDLRPWVGRARAMLQYAMTRKGPLSLSVNQGGGFVRLQDGAGPPDQQLYFSPVSYTRAAPGKRPMMSPDPFPGFLLGVSPCRPTSEGEVSLASPNPGAPPKIRPNYLSTDKDRRDMLDGIRLLRRIAGTEAFGEVIDSEISPGTEAQCDQALGTHVRDTAWTVFHPCGTCRMGQDRRTSAITPRLSVHGVGGLRVVDASIFPNITSGNLNAPTIMAAERAADLILEDARP